MAGVEDRHKLVEPLIDTAIENASNIVGYRRTAAVLQDFANKHCYPICVPKEFAISRILLARVLYFGRWEDELLRQGAVMMLQEVWQHKHMAKAYYRIPLFRVKERAAILGYGEEAPY